MNNGYDYRDQSFDQQNAQQGAPNEQTYYAQTQAVPPADPKGHSAQTMGIVSIVGIFFCQLISLICGIMAMRDAKASFEMLGYETSEAKTGKLCGLIGAIIGGVSLGGAVLGVLVYVIYIVFIVAAIGASGGLF